MIKCEKFFNTKERGVYGDNCIKGAHIHFNEWAADNDDVDIFHIEVLGNSNGCCEEIVVFYKIKSTG